MTVGSVAFGEQLREVRAPSTPCPSLAEKSHEDP